MRIEQDLLKFNKLSLLACSLCLSGCVGFGASFGGFDKLVKLGENKVEIKSVRRVQLEPRFWGKIELAREPEVLRELKLIHIAANSHFVQSYERRRLYISEVRGVMATYGLPPELADLPMIESGYNPKAVSYAGAGGLWQFMPATARAYGLKVGLFQDDRRDVLKSTRAAARYLLDLYREFDDWFLALTAYNIGSFGLRRAMKASGSSNYWDLLRSGTLKREAVRFVPKFLSTCLALKAYEAKLVSPDVTKNES